MRILHVLSSGVATQNARSFVLPLVHVRRELRDRGWAVRVFSKAAAELTDCDALFVDGKSFEGAKVGGRSLAEEKVSEWAGQCPVGFFDLSDSTVITKPGVLPYAALYIKNQLLRDRELFGRSLYGYRLYTDYYHSQFGVEDRELEKWSEKIPGQYVGKLRIGWNAGIGNYGLLGPKVAALAFRLANQYVYGPTARYCSPSAMRSVQVNCRMATGYARRTVAFQRQEVSRMLAEFSQTSRVSKRQYFRELRDTKVVLSPFGWGEINQRDFEAAIAGAAILKPNLSHLETWPDYFQPDVTYVGHKWDFSDVREKVDLLLGDDMFRLEIAHSAQDRFKMHDLNQGGRGVFADRAVNIAEETLRSSQN